MAGAAAIFDLDRTLLRTSSTPAINEALFKQGVARQSSVPGQALMMRIYDTFGESLPSMALARAAAFMAKGWAVAEVQEAAELAADELAPRVLPYVPSLLASHRAAGRSLVLATTTPHDLVRPLAARLGIQTVIATRYGSYVDDNGVERYDGSVRGGFVWATGKLQAVRRWSLTTGIDLRRSWAYSDSVYDVPLLSAVGYPTAVNPDYRLHGVAVLRRWPTVYLDSPAGVPKLLGVEALDVLRVLSRELRLPYARFDVAGSEHIPRRGPVIIAANHLSYFDPVAYGQAIFKAGRNPRGLADKEFFDAPLIGTLLRLSGAICVDGAGRGTGAYAEAEAALRNGEALVITPQGTMPRDEAFFNPRLRAKSGVARLAAATGAPVIPLGVWGTEQVWPRSSRLPNVTNVLHPPNIWVRVGPPVTGLTGKDFRMDTKKIMAAIAAELPPEARPCRIPPTEELTRTMPTGQHATP